MDNAIKKQVKYFFEKGETITNIINYLFTCDYKIIDIFNLLMSSPFNYEKQKIKDVFCNDFNIEISQFY